MARNGTGPLMTIRWAGRTTVIAAALLAAACAGADKPPPAGEPTFYASMAKPGAQLDAGAAASMITGYRTNNGLGAVALDPELMRLAHEHTRSMVEKNKLRSEEHTSELQSR